MKHQYLFLRENAPLNARSVVYHVWVGCSDHEQKLLAQVAHECKFHGWTLRRWDESIDMYLLVESERVFTDSGILNFGFSSADLTISELRELVYSGCWDSFESTICVTQSYLHMLREARPDLYRRRILNPKSEVSRPPLRKNLSSVSQHL